MKCPRSAKPSVSRAASAARTRANFNAKRRRKRIRGDRAQTFQPSAHDLDQRRFQRPFLSGMTGGRRNRGFDASRLAIGRETAASARPRSTMPLADPICAWRVCRVRARRENAVQPGPPRASSSVKKPSHIKASCNSSAFVASGQASSRTLAMASGSSRPRLSAASGESQRRVMTACARRSSSGASSRNAQGRAESTSSASGDGSVRSRVITFIAPDSMRVRSCSKPAISIASVRQSPIVWRTSGWSGISTLANNVFGAGDLIWKHRANEILGVHPREVSRNFSAASKARQCQRDAGDPAPAGQKHRRIEQCLGQHGAYVRRMKITLHVGKLETMRRGQREQDIVVGRGGLQLEIELAAKALAQRKPPGPVDPASIGRMNDEAACRRIRQKNAQRPECLASADSPRPHELAAKYSTSSVAGSSVKPASSQSHCNAPSPAPSLRQQRCDLCPQP